jgi:hypothetical protein
MNTLAKLLFRFTRKDRVAVSKHSINSPELLDKLALQVIADSKLEQDIEEQFNDVTLVNSIKNTLKQAYNQGYLDGRETSKGY